MALGIPRVAAAGLDSEGHSQILQVNDDGALVVYDQAMADAIADEAVLEVTANVSLGNIVVVSAEYTRPSDSTGYSLGDVIANSTSAPVPLSFANIAKANDVGGYIVGARLATNVKSIVPRIRVHLWRHASPTLSNDNAAHKSVYADEAKRICSFDLPALRTSHDTANSDSSFAEDFSLRIPFIPASGTRLIYATLETREDVAAASGQKFGLTLWADQN